MLHVSSSQLGGNLNKQRLFPSRWCKVETVSVFLLLVNANLVCLNVKLTQHESLVALFDNQTWYKQGVSEEFQFSSETQAWKHPQVSVFITLLLFIVMKVKSSSLNPLLRAVAVRQRFIYLQFFDRLFSCVIVKRRL